jgi:hypothetical protein
MENVLKISEPLKALQSAASIINKNKKLVLGIAGVASVAAILYLRSKRDDTPVFEKTLSQLNAVEEQAVSQMSRLPITDMPAAAVILKDSTLPVWQAFRKQIAGTESLNLDKALNQKRKLLLSYADLRVQQSKLLYRAFHENTNAYDDDLATVYNDINGILAELQH